MLTRRKTGIDTSLWDSDALADSDRGSGKSLCDAEAILESTYCPTLFNSGFLHEALNHGSNLGVVVLALFMAAMTAKWSLNSRLTAEGVVRGFILFWLRKA